MDCQKCKKPMRLIYRHPPSFFHNIACNFRCDNCKITYAAFHDEGYKIYIPHYPELHTSPENKLEERA